MNYRNVLNVISFLIVVIGTCMFSAVPVSWYMKDDFQTVTIRFAACAAICCSLGLAGVLAFRPQNGIRVSSGIREGFATVGGSWLAAVFLASLPFIFIGRMLPADAIFETASGCSTTGATVIDSSLVLQNGKTLERGLESLPFGLLYWRCLLNWLGGIGIVVFALLVLPLLGGAGGKSLYNAEVPGVKTASDQVLPRMQSYAKMILTVYCILTVLCALCFRLCGMSAFDAVCHSFSAVATGGFSTHTASFGYFSNPMAQWTAIIFMMISAINFTMTLKMFVTRKVYYWKDEETRFFTVMCVLSAVVIGLQLYFTHKNGIVMSDGRLEPRSLESSFRCAAFQVVSLVTTSGFSISDYISWGLPSVMMILFFLSFIGGCGGSTAGGMKCVRLLIAVKQVFAETRRCLFPRLLTDVRLNGVRLDDGTIRKTMAFLVLYVLILFFVSLSLLFLTHTDMITAISASVACLSNVGPGFGQVGPMDTYSWMTAPAKLLLSLTMVVGRLELYTLLVLLLPSFWKK